VCIGNASFYALLVHSFFNFSAEFCAVEMILKDTIETAVKSQKENLEQSEDLIEREIEGELDLESAHC
jgi:hypothetical protein